MKKVISFLLFCLLAITQTVRADVLGEYQFEGMLDGRIPVEISFAVNCDEIAVGEILYPEAKHPAPILIVGSMHEWGYTFSEYQDDGTITGYISLQISEKENSEPEVTSGTWSNPKTDKQFSFTNMKCVSQSVDVPKFLDYEDPQNIGREYSFRTWSPQYNSYMGGNITFRGAGKHKLHFKVCNAQRNIAEGESEPNRPAELAPYTYDSFTYNNVNECGYGFSAYFFKRFVVLKTITDYNTLGCFGMGASFDGVYIKVKQ